MMDLKTIRLKVVDANSVDPFKSRVRLDRENMNNLDLKLNDYVAVKGTKVAIGRVYEMREEDTGSGEIRLDTIMRENCGSKINELVDVCKVEVVPARTVKLTPAGRNYPLLNKELVEFFRRLLYETPMVTGNVISINLPGDFRIGGTSTPLYRSIETEPDDVPVYISKDSEIFIVD